MKSCKTAQRQRLIFAYTIVCILTVALLCRLAYLMLGKADYYGAKAKDVQQRERSIKAERGIIFGNTNYTNTSIYDGFELKEYT